ncbi:MAG: twin-arginine translocation signal domain-containing protein [Streptococcus salivarius]
MTDEKFLDQKMDRREFLKKAGIGGAGLALGLSGASAFFANQDSSSKKLMMVMKILASMASTRLGLRLLCRRLATWWC